MVIIRFMLFAVLATALLLPTSSFAQDMAEVFNGQVIVSPKGIASRPFSTRSGPGPLASTVSTSAPALSDATLRQISQAAGIYVPATPGAPCAPGPVACKPTQPTAEQFNLIDVGPLGDSSRVIEVTSTAQDAVSRTVSAFNASADFEASPNYWRRTSQSTEPDYYLQWGFMGAGIFGGANFVDAWRRTLGSPTLVVAVIDTGVLRTHPDLAPALVGGIDMISVVNLSGDGDGRDFDATDSGDFVDVATRNFVASFGVSCSLRNSSWHGTHVAGTIAARVNASFGTGGAPNVRILPVRVLGKCGGSDRDIIEGLAWAMGIPVPGIPNNPNPASIINMSLGAAAPCTAPYQRLLAEARRRGILVVVSAGNDNRDTAGYAPAGCSDAIVVSAHDRSGLRAGFSNFGRNVTISAPGVDIVSTTDLGTTLPVVPNSRALQGTSMAAPHVAAALALLKSLRPTITTDEAVRLLRASSSPFLSGSGCSSGESRAGLCGAGMLNAANLVAQGSPVQPVPQPQPQPQPVPPPPVPDDGGACFIATAAYGSSFATEVVALRRFRDDVLMSHAAGRAFVDLYYEFSPRIADRIRGSENLRSATRGLLWPLLMTVRFPNFVSGAALILMFGALAMFVVRKRRQGVVALLHQD